MNQNQNDNGLAGSVEKLRTELDSWLGYAMEKGEQAIESMGLKGTEAGPIIPKFDVAELTDSVLVDVDLAGVKPESVDVMITGNVLTISGERPQHIYPDGTRVHLRERQAGKFSRSVPLPIAVDPDQVTAETRNGVLTVRLAKPQTQTERKIKVNVMG